MKSELAGHSSLTAGAVFSWKTLRRHQLRFWVMNSCARGWTPNAYYAKLDLMRFLIASRSHWSHKIGVGLVPDRASQKQIYIERSVISILLILVIAVEKKMKGFKFLLTIAIHISSAQLEIHIMTSRTKKRQTILKRHQKNVNFKSQHERRWLY
jgi:hypothetical protein